LAASPGVVFDCAVDAGSGTFYFSMSGSSISLDSRYESRELGFFLFFDTQRDGFTRAEAYNLRRTHEFSSYPVYWAGRATNEESLAYLKSMIDSAAPEINRLSDRAAFAIALHDDAKVEPLRTELIKRPVAESIRNRAIYRLGYTPESQSKNALLADIVRSTKESIDARQR